MRFACLRCAAGAYFVSAGGALWALRPSLINYILDNIPKYVCLTVIYKITKKMSVDRLIVQLQEMTQRNMKCKYRNTSGNTQFRAF